MKLTLEDLAPAAAAAEVAALAWAASPLLRARYFGNRDGYLKEAVAAALLPGKPIPVGAGRPAAAFAMKTTPRGHA